MRIGAKLTDETGRLVEVQTNRIHLWTKPDSRVVAEMVHFDVLKDATAGVDRDGGNFAPPAPGTARQKRSTTPLVNSGDMLASMRKSANRRRARVAVVRRLFYGGLVNGGTRHMPARQFLGFSKGLEKEVVEYSADQIAKRANAFGDPRLDKATRAGPANIKPLSGVLKGGSRRSALRRSSGRRGLL